MKHDYRGSGGWSTLGLEIVLCVLFGFFGGRWLDGHLGTDPWLQALGFLFGCGAAGKAVHRSMKEMQEVTEREERRRGNPRPVYERPQDRKPTLPAEVPGGEEHDEHPH